MSGPRQVRGSNCSRTAAPRTPHTRCQNSSIPARRRREIGPRRGTSGTARPPSNQHRPDTKRVPPPERRHRIPSLSSGRLGPPTPTRAPPRAVLDRGSRLARGMSAGSGWSKLRHEGAVVVFPEAITGQAQSFASVSSSSWQPSVRAPRLQCQRRPSALLRSPGLICATRPPHSPLS